MSLLSLIPLPHLASQKATVRVDWTLQLHFSVVGLLLHSLGAPVDSKLSNTRFISQDSPFGEVNYLLRGG